MTKQEIIVTVFVENDGDGFYAYAPALKGLHVGGDTEDEALRNVTDGVILYLESLVRHGEPIPKGPHLKIEKHEKSLNKTVSISPKELSVPILWTSQMTLGDRLKISPREKSYAH